MDYNKLFDMTNKICVVTGGTGYLGSERSKILKQFGATVIVADIRENTEYWENSQVTYDQFILCDISSTESIRSCFQQVADRYGRIDVLVNCASYGAGYGQGSQLEFMSDEVFHIGVDGTVGATFRGMREVVPFMKEKGGSIINYCSMYGVVAPDLRIYGDNPQKQPPQLRCRQGRSRPDHPLCCFRIERIRHPCQRCYPRSFPLSQKSVRCGVQSEARQQNHAGSFRSELRNCRCHSAAGIRRIYLHDRFQHYR